MREESLSSKTGDEIQPFTGSCGSDRILHEEPSTNAAVS